MSVWLLMYWRVLIYAFDYKHPDLSLTHPQTHSIMRGVDTPRVHTVNVRFCVHNGLSGRGEAQNRLYQQCQCQLTL